MTTVLATRPLTGPGAGAQPGTDNNPATESESVCDNESVEALDAPVVTMRERCEALQLQLAERVASITTSDDWMQWVRFARTMHRNRSLSNQLLIWIQNPEATACLGFRAWQGQKRWVRKGEKGIRIWAPVTTKTVTENSDDTGSDSQRTVAGFRLVSVFDIAQTDGHNPIPDQPLPTLLEGDAPALLWERLAGLVTENGFVLERGECGLANGWTNFTTRTVRVRDDVDAAQATKTLAHELGHVLMMHEPSLHVGANCRGHREVEAETFATIVCDLAGLDTAKYSVTYVGHWLSDLVTEDDDIISVLIKHTQRVLDVVDTVIEPLLNATVTS
jgi:antirestriction protein ArdC